MSGRPIKRTLRRGDLGESLFATRARESHISGRFAARLKTRLRRSTCRAVTSVP